MSVLYCLAGEANYRPTKTVEVGVSGALLILPQTVNVGQSLLLINPKISKQVACRVCYIRQKADGYNLVGVEFVAQSPDFWGITLSIKEWEASAGSLPPSIDSAANVPAQAAAKGWRNPKKLLIALAMPAALLILWAGMAREIPAPPAPPAAPAESATISSGLPQEVASMIPDLAGFRIAVPADFDTDATAWLQSWNEPASGQIQGNYVGSAAGQAYILVGKDKSWRVVIISGGQIFCDRHFQAIAIAARVPVEFLSNVQWSDPAPPAPDGDGLLVAGSGKDSASGVVILLHKGDVLLARPADYRQVSLAHVGG
jgi:hypothetical protein